MFEGSGNIIANFSNELYLTWRIFEICYDEGDNENDDSAVVSGVNPSIIHCPSTSHPSYWGSEQFHHSPNKKKNNVSGANVFGNIVKI